MFIHNFNSTIISVGPLDIRWYSLAYILGIFLGLYYGKYLIRSFSNKFIISEKNLDDYIIWSIIGILIGGRLGYVFIYNLEYYLNNPIEVFMIWKGGMSFHGGLIGIIISSFFFSKKNNISFWSLTDLLACVSPIGIFFGRIANFINAELVGKISSVSWSVIFPTYDNKPRHPSQLYEAFLEGILLFILLNFFLRAKVYKIGQISILFLILYSFFRIIGEIFREPDQHIGYLVFGLSTGSILSLLIIIIGCLTLIVLKKNDYK
jgi:phosphatidylglycerol:prolipoprotein diacylglycerol transferase